MSNSEGKTSQQVYGHLGLHVQDLTLQYRDETFLYINIMAVLSWFDHQAKIYHYPILFYFLLTESSDE